MQRFLLKSTPLSVREISEQLGFATRNYFSAVFQQVTGKTPMEFRETIKQNRHPAVPFGGIGQDACSAMMKKKWGRMAQLRNFSFRVTPKSWAMARRSSSVMVCRMMPPPMESTLT
ncbi:MAG: helix-turn-helix domain-containing protein [Faecalibacterium prausnitzii]